MYLQSVSYQEIKLPIQTPPVVTHVREFIYAFDLL
jgi:hypothetical protein